MEIKLKVEDRAFACHLQLRPYVFSAVGTSRCNVRAACSGATPSNGSVPWAFVPPATARAGTAQRAIPTIALNTYFRPDRGNSFLPAVAPTTGQQEVLIAKQRFRPFCMDSLAGES